MSGGRYISIIHRIKVNFWTATAFFLINALTILAMPKIVEISQETGKQLFLILLGSIFWISLLLGYVFVYLANGDRKYFIMRRLDGDLSMGCHMGLITFFSNIPAVIVDSAMIASFIALFIIYYAGAINTYITYVMLTILVFTLNMHCMFNGRIYRTTKYKRIRRENDYE